MASGHLEKRSKKGWTIVIDYGRVQDPVTGKWKQVRRRKAYKNINKTEAQKILHATLAEINKGTYIEPSLLTVGEYLKKWYDERCAPRLRPKTLEAYNNAIGNYLVPAFGLIPLASLQPLTLQETYSRWIAEGKHPRSVELAHQVLNIALNQAVKWQLLVRNVAALVDPPRLEPREKVVPSPEDIGRLIEAAAKTPILRVVILAMHTGMRRGELLALRWDCVDLDKGSIRVEWSLQRVNGQIVVDKPKSKKSRRVVPIDEEAVEMLRRMREASKHDLVFHRGDGTPLDPSTVTHQFARIAERAGFKGMRFHNLRDTYATYALLAGVDLRVVQELLGHEDVSTTAKVYTHVLDELKSDAAQMIASVLPKTGKRQTSTNSPEKKDTES